MTLMIIQEIKPIMVEAMKAKQSLKAAEIQDGDIVCFQRVPSINGSENSDKSVLNLANRLTNIDIDSSQSLSDKSSIKSEKTLQNSKSSRSGSVASVTTLSSNGTSAKKSVSNSSLDRITNAIDYYEFLQHKRIVYFAPHPVRCQNKESYQKFSLAMSSKISYDQVAARVGNEIGVDPTHIRFWTVNTNNGNPKTAVKRGAGQTLHGVLNPPYSAYNNGNQQQDSLFFEVLDISLAELDTKKPVKIVWLSEGISKETIYDVLVPKVGNIDDLVQALIKKAGLDDEATAGPIRILEVHSSKIHRESPRDQQVSQLNDYVTVYAERIPEEDLGPDVDAANDFVQAFHFQGEPSKSHGVPFKFRMIPNEIFADTKKRLEKRTGIKGKNFEKIKFAVVKRSSYSRPVYLTDGMSSLSPLLTMFFSV
jgi:ubiquitin carboxyl-terminal hydrolase 7